MKKGQIIALSVLGVILIVIIIVIAKNIQTKSETTTGGTTNVVTKGLADIYDIFTGFFKKKPVTPYCDCSKPGFTSDGAADSSCNVGGIFYDQGC